MITNKQLDYLKKMTHHLKPVVTIGSAGLTTPVLQEIDSSLEHHELLKIKTSAASKTEKRDLAENICHQVKASFVMAIGHTIAIYRPAKKRSEKHISLPT